MKYTWNYGSRVLVIPADALSRNADAQQLRVLLTLASDPTLAGRPEELARLAGCTVRAVPEALRFWEEAGILNAAPDDNGAEKPAPAVPAALPEKSGARPAAKLAHPDSPPAYTAAEMNEMMERRQSLRVMVDEAQRTLGKMLTPYEINILLGMVSYLGLDEDYILLLLAHCKRIGVTGLRTVERYAIKFSDSGIRTASELEDRVQTLEEAHTLEGKVRAMFGMEKRALTAKERAMLEAWVGYGYGEEIIRRAYEIAVNSTGKSSVPYANSILERWHSEGLKTVGEIDRRMEEERAARTANGQASSFDAEDFFAKALKRSFRTPGNGDNPDRTAGGKD